MPMTAKEMLKFLAKQGIEKVKGGGKGGHQKVVNPATGQTSEVPMHGELSKSLEHKILRQLGLK